ncbi:MAG TPA: hypothetical protein VHW24_18380 [Bryobacteraceae bacterium]|jgi:hypothetical protein|nr:hypothetical protein [Bryobacteraceae bacterium]
MTRTTWPGERFSAGFPVTLTDDSDRSLLATLGNCVNNLLLDTLQVLPESRSLDLRVEAFNIFNHAQFYGSTSVDGEVNDPNFGRVVSAASPRLLQVAAKFRF